MYTDTIVIRNKKKKYHSVKYIKYKKKISVYYINGHRI